jgi:hypothetical protein
MRLTHTAKKSLSLKVESAVDVDSGLDVLSRLSLVGDVYVYIPRSNQPERMYW